MNNERQQAFNLLIRLLNKKTSLTLLLSEKNLTPFTKELCFGFCRYYFRLQNLAKMWVKKEPKSSEVWICLLLGLYQLHYLKVPDFAAVKETVALLDSIKAQWAKGFVNGVLRQYCRNRQTLPQDFDTNPNNNHPDWFIKKIKKAWPNDWETILIANDIHPPMTLRINKKLYTPPEYQTLLEKTGISSKLCQYATEGLTLDHPVPIEKLPEFAQGACSVQDEAAQLASALLDLKPNLRILDACAAPGGKTAHILEIEPHLNELIAIDNDRQRIGRITENLRRLNLNAELIHSDAEVVKNWWNGKLFDRILLDAPCTATGVVRRHPDIKLLRAEKDIQTVTPLQKNLLHELWSVLKPGGRMVYATCSILPEENDQQIQQFLNDHSDSSIPKMIINWGRFTGFGWQILPGDSNMDGFFYSILQKNEN